MARDPKLAPTDPNALSFHAVSGKVTSTAASTINPVVAYKAEDETIATVIERLRRVGTHPLAHVSIYDGGFGHGMVRLANGRFADLA
jgi:hypothetical protein